MFELNTLLVDGLYFVIALLFIIGVKFFKRLDKKEQVMWDIPPKYSYVLLVTAIILCLLTISPIAGEGYDCMVFKFTTNYIRENGLLTIFNTDRPIMYFVTYFIGTGTFSVPIAGTLFAIFYVFTVYILTRKLTNNFFLSSLAVLVTVNSNIFRHLTINFLGNLLGLCFLNLFFVSVIILKQNSNLWNYILSVSFFVLIYFSHIFTALVALIVISCFWLFYSRKKRVLVILLIICFLLYITFTIVNGDNTSVFVRQVNLGVVKRESSFLVMLHNDWNSDYIWNLCFFVIGLIYVVFDRKNKYLTTWSISITACLLLASAFAGRIFLYLPFSILFAYGLYYVTKHSKILRICFLLFLVIMPLNYFDNVNKMNIKYFEEEPFYWRTQYIELEQLRWIRKDFNINEIVVVTDVVWEGVETDRKLIAGVHFRILLEVGNNVYFGKLCDLLEEKPDTRGEGITKHPGMYSSLNIEWTLENKTILIPTMVYRITEAEKEITYEVTDGIYIVKQLTEEEKQNWLTKTNG